MIIIPAQNQPKGNRLWKNVVQENEKSMKKGYGASGRVGQKVVSGFLRTFVSDGLLFLR